jgi:hypothetical protein
MNTLMHVVPVVPADRYSDIERERILRFASVSYLTAAGLVNAVFHRTTRLHNGKIGAFFDVRYRNPQSGRVESTRYLYGVDRDGRPKELKKLSTLVK